MSIIHMETETVEQLAVKMRLTINQLSDSYDNVSSHVNRLSRHWDGGDSYSFIRKANRRLNTISYKIDELDALQVKLVREMDQWMITDGNTSRTFTDLKFLNKLFPNAIYDYEGYDRVIRQVDGSGKEFILNGLLINAAGGESDSDLYDQLNVEYRDKYLDYSYEELMALAILQENGKLPEGWPNVPENHIIDTKIKTTFWENDFGTAQAAVLAGQGGSENCGYDYSVLSAEASGDAFIEMKDGAFKGGVEGQAGVYLAKISGNASTDIPMGPATLGLAAAGTAYVGAEACGEFKGVFDLKKGDVGFEAGGEVFAGGKIEGEAEAGLEYGGVEGKVKASGSLNYGIGASANADVGFNQGTIKADIQIGATLGLGFDVGVSFELDVSGATDTVLEAGKSALDWMF